MSFPTQIDPEKIREIIVATLAEANVVSSSEEIFGGSSSMDSLGLVNFLSDLEYRIDEEFGRQIVLASDRAMSRSRSPFRDVSSLTEYILEFLPS